MLLICCTIKYSEISHRIFIHESCVELRVHFEMRADVEFKIHRCAQEAGALAQMIATRECRHVRKRSCDRNRTLVSRESHASLARAFAFFFTTAC